VGKWPVLIKIYTAFIRGGQQQQEQRREKQELAHDEH
jgi:hypothetical protein